MKITTVGTRGVVFTYDDFSTETTDCPTNVYVINGDKHIFVCDTYLGPEAMEAVILHIKQNFKKKPIVIFNSHYDFDHHWGNCAFDSKMILAHRLCRDLIEENGEADLETQKKWLKGDVKIILPDTTFEEEYNFEDEDVYFFHSPGHTEDSSSCYDKRDKILFVGDNIEKPIPYIRSDLEGVRRYIDTLKKYQSYEYDILIPGHGPISDNTLLETNLSYLDKFPELKDPVNVDLNGRQYYLIHLQNLSTLAKEYIKLNQKSEGIKYYQKLIALEKDTKILSEENRKYFNAKINELKNNKM